MYTVVPATQLEFSWFKNCIFDHLRGGLSGAIYLKNAYAYFSNTDGFLKNRRRALDSNRLAKYNRGYQGAGFIFAINGSKVILKG